MTKIPRWIEEKVRLAGYEIDDLDGLLIETKMNGETTLTISARNGATTVVSLEGPYE